MDDGGRGDDASEEVATVVRSIKLKCHPLRTGPEPLAARCTWGWNSDTPRLFKNSSAPPRPEMVSNRTQSVSPSGLSQTTIANKKGFYSEWKQEKGQGGGGGGEQGGGDGGGRGRGGGGGESIFLRGDKGMPIGTIIYLKAVKRISACKEVVA